MKIAIIIYSESGRTQQAAELIGKGIEQVEGCEYRIMNVDPQAGKPVDNDYIHQADAVIFGTDLLCQYLLAAEKVYRRNRCQLCR